MNAKEAAAISVTSSIEQTKETGEILGEIHRAIEASARKGLCFVDVITMKGRRQIEEHEHFREMSSPVFVAIAELLKMEGYEVNTGGGSMTVRW